MLAKIVPDWSWNSHVDREVIKVDSTSLSQVAHMLETTVYIYIYVCCVETA